MKITKVSATLITVISVAFILFYTKNILIPFVLAVILWFLVKKVKNLISRIPFIGHRFPNWFQNILSFGIIFGILSLFVRMLIINIQQFNEVLPFYQANITNINASIKEMFNFDILNWLKDFTGNYDFSTIISAIINSITTIFSDAFMVLLYLLFILLEEAVFQDKLRLFYNDEGSYLRSKKIITEVSDSIDNYISLKTVVSLMTGILSYIALHIIGVDFAIFWAFLIFLLNYIPTIGSLIATLFPAVIALLQFGELLPGLWVLLAVGAIQIIIGNIVEPKVMGNSLNVSALVVILALTFWGTLWGILGMVLSVPITVIMIIIMSKFETTRGIAILLSEKGSFTD